MKKIRISCPAKINLNLKVLGKRDDGYHEIVSFMQKVSLFDRVSISLTDGGGVTILSDQPELPLDGRNLAFQAAEALLKNVDGYFGIKISIKKAIPIGAGLGGGSSNCAAVLKGLNEILDLGLSREELMDVGSSLGADVPFLILDKNQALARGKGEKLFNTRPLPLVWYIIVYPNFSISTRWAYENFLELTNETDGIMKGVEGGKSMVNGQWSMVNGQWSMVNGQWSMVNGQWSISNQQSAISNGHSELRTQGGVDWNEFLTNDLERVVIKEYPEIRKIKDVLMLKGAMAALMSGSGSSVFGVFADDGEANKAADEIRDKHPWRVFVVHGL